MYMEFALTLVVSGCLWFVFRNYLKREKRLKINSSVTDLGRQFLYGNRAHFMLLKSKRAEIPLSICIFQTYVGWAELFRKEGWFHTTYGSRNVIVLYSGPTVEPLLSSKSEIEKSGAYKPAIKYLGGGLVLSKGERWRRNRKLLTPAFHFNILEDFLPVIDFHSLILVEKLRACVNQEYINITPFIALCTFDIILETALGTRLSVQNDPNHPMLVSSNRLLEIWINRVFSKFPIFDWFFEYTSYGKEFLHHMNVVKKLTTQVINERKANLKKEYKNNEGEVNGTKKRRPFLDLLLTHHINDSTTYTDDYIHAETNTFTGAGHDTTAVGIIFTLFLLGHHPDVQQKLYEEVTSILSDDQNIPITTDDLRKMKYLDCVLKESQRLYPSIHLISRKLTNGLKIGDVAIPKKTIAVVLISVLHRDPEVFPEPEIFNPDRFLPENVRGRHPYAYTPFSAGPRNCIGQKFAVLEEKAVIARVIRNFEFKSLDQRDKIVVVPEIVGKPNREMRMKLSLRQNN